MANNNMYLRCLICHPQKGSPVDWATEMDTLHYVGSGYPGMPWVTKRDEKWPGLLDAWLDKHFHPDDPVASEMHFELVDESQPKVQNAPGYYERCANPECRHFACHHAMMCETGERVCDHGCQCKEFVMDAEEHARQIAVGFREPTS